MKPAACRSCGASIIWAHTLTGKRMPVDAEPHQEGNLTVLDIDTEPKAMVVPGDIAAMNRANGAPLWRSHFVTCPQATQHRRKP